MNVIASEAPRRDEARKKASLNFLSSDSKISPSGSHCAGSGQRQARLATFVEVRVALLKKEAPVDVSIILKAGRRCCMDVAPPLTAVYLMMGTVWGHISAIIH
ncbi:unnamed protein product [Boreogadus saida]